MRRPGSTQRRRPIVVLIAPDPPGTRGGIARVSTSVGEAARAAGYGVRELHLGRGRLARLRLVAEAMFAVAGRGRLAIFTHVNQSPIGVLMPWTPCVVWTHGVEVWRPLTVARRRALRSADCVVTVSHFTARELRSSHGVSAVVVANPVVAALVGPLQPTAPGDDLLVVSRLGADATEKGVDLSLHAWAAALPAVGTLRQLVIVGTGTEATRLHELADSLGIAARVSFLGDVDDRRLNEQYETARALLTPSTIEGFGLTVVEAMSHGRAVVGCSEGALPELIQHMWNGLVVPATTEDVAHAIIALDDPVVAKRLGENAHSTAANYTSTRFTSEVAEVLDIVAHRRRRARTGDEVQ